jgi:ribonuclease D
MARWQAEEARKREEERQRALAEERRIARAAEDARLAAERQASEAKTKTQRVEAERLRQIAEAQEVDRQRAEDARKTAEGAKAVKGVGSRVTTVTYAEVTDLTAFLKAVVEGKVPEICVQVNESVLKTYWEDDAGLVSAWPGIEVRKQTRVGGR